MTDRVVTARFGHAIANEGLVSGSQLWAGGRQSHARALLSSPSFVLVVVVLLVAGVILGADLGTLQLQLTLCWAMFATTNVGLLLTAGRIAWGATDRGSRWVWGGIATAGLLQAVGDLVQLGLLAARPVDLSTGLGGPAQKALVLAGTAVPLGVVLLLTPAAGRRSRRPLARLALDIAIVGVTATAFGAYLILPDSGAASPFVWLSLLIGPGLFLSVVLGVVSISRSVSPPMSSLAGAAIVVAATLEAGAPTGVGVLTRGNYVAWILGLAAVASALLLVAASLQREIAQTSRSRRPGPRRSLVVLVP